MSISDILSSIGYFMSTWAIPSDSHAQNVGANCYHGNIGNVTTCSVQGLFIHVGSVSMMIYHAVLSLYFRLRIQFNWNTSRYAKVEFIMLGFPVLFTFGSGAICMKFDAYNPLLFTCWLVSYPAMCTFQDVDCVRGEHLQVLATMTHLVPFVGCIYIVSVSMFGLYKYVKEEELRMSEFRIQGASETVRSEQSRKVFRQACLYGLAFIVVWVPPVICFLLESLDVVKETSLSKTRFYVMALFLPLHGFFNAIIYSPEFAHTIIGYCVWLTKPLRSIFVRCSAGQEWSFFSNPATPVNVPSETIVISTLAYE